jgi:hypothetical protein
MQLTVDTKQRISTAGTFVLEFYKVLMATLLGVFVPQNCGSELCSYTDNISNTETLHLVMNISNVITFIAVLVFYGIELHRENWSIKYLDIDKSKPNSNLDHEIESYPKIKQSLHIINNRYLYSTYAALGLMVYNFIISAIAIWLTNPSTQTAAAFISFFLLVIGKLTGAKGIAEKSLQKERVYSGYLKTSKTYNTIDADHAIEFKEDKSDVESSAPVVKVDTDNVSVEVDMTGKSPSINGSEPSDSSTKAQADVDSESTNSDDKITVERTKQTSLSDIANNGVNYYM